MGHNPHFGNHCSQLSFPSCCSTKLLFSPYLVLMFITTVSTVCEDAKMWKISLHNQYIYFCLKKKAQDVPAFRCLMCSSYCVCLWVCGTHVRISFQNAFAIHSSLPRTLSQSLPTYTAFFVFLCVLFWPAAIVSVQIDWWFGFASWLPEWEWACRKKGVERSDRQGLTHQM